MAGGLSFYSFIRGYHYEGDGDMTIRAEKTLMYLQRMLTWRKSEPGMTKLSKQNCSVISFLEKDAPVNPPPTPPPVATTAAPPRSPAAPPQFSDHAGDARL